MYISYPDLIKQIYHEMEYEHFDRTLKDSKQSEMIYWGYAGKFERNILNYFYNKAEHWIKDGPLPALPSNMPVQE